MRCPKAERGDSEVDMLAGPEAEGPRKLKGHASSGARQSLQSGLCTAVAEVAVDKSGETDRALQSPSDENIIKVTSGGKTV